MLMRNYSIALCFITELHQRSCTKENKTKPSPADALKSETIADIQSRLQCVQKYCAATKSGTLQRSDTRGSKKQHIVKNTLRDSGFTLEEGVAGIPTAFVATYGSGSR